MSFIDIYYKDVISYILTYTRFHTESRGEEITLKIPITEYKNNSDFLSIIISPYSNQIVIDVFIGGLTEFSGITALDMCKPICPIYKHISPVNTDTSHIDLVMYILLHTQFHQEHISLKIPINDIDFISIIINRRLEQMTIDANIGNRVVFNRNINLDNDVIIN